MRYLKRLESRDLSLTTSMISLGSCTMKLNAAAAMLPVTWPEFSLPHPFAPREQMKGYAQIIEAVKPHLSETLFPGGETAGWWVKCVQLDLEAKGILKRAPKAPVRLWKA